MPKSLNRWTGLGNAGSDVDLKYSQSGTAVATVSIACNEEWKDESGQQQSRVEWVRLVAFKKTAEIMHQYLHKGDRVYVEGKLQTRSWDDKNSGEKKYMTEIVVNNVILLGSKPEGQDTYQAEAFKAQSTGVAPVDDGLPF